MKNLEKYTKYKIIHAYTFHIYTFDSAVRAEKALWVLGCHSFGGQRWKKIPEGSTEIGIVLSRKEVLFYAPDNQFDYTRRWHCEVAAEMTGYIRALCSKSLDKIRLDRFHSMLIPRK